MAKSVRFNLIFADLDRAIVCARFTPAEDAVLLAARELSYSRARRAHLADPLPFTLNQSRIAEYYGLSRGNVCHAVRSLERSRVLLVGDDGHRINKQYDQWIGRHKLSERHLRTCREALASDGNSVAHALHPTVARALQDEADHCSACATPPVAHALHPCSASATPTCSARATPDVAPPTPPIEERARQKTEERFKKIPEERSERERACEPDAIDRLASEIVGRIWGLTESDGQPDSMLVYSVASSIRSAGPESSPDLARAQAVKAARKSDPASYFFRIARTGGLREDPINLRAGSSPAQSRAADLKAERLASAERLRIKLLAEDEEDQRNGTGR